MTVQRLVLAASIVVLCANAAGCRRTPTKEDLSTAATPATTEIKPKDQSQQIAGHQATVRCLRGERGMTDGDELRCEDWSYVIANYDDSKQP